MYYSLHLSKKMKKIYILLTIVGMAAAGPASEALDQRFSVPDREGWETSQEILQKYGNGGESLPLASWVLETVVGLAPLM